MNSILSRRTPLTARMVAITLLWISRTLASLLVACPLVFAITGTGLASGPEHDALLFRPGALILLELVRVGAPLLGAAVKVSLVLWATCAVVGLVPLGVAFDLLQSQDADALGTRALRGFRLFPPFLALSGITLLAQAATLVAASLLEGALSSAFEGHDERLLSLTPVVSFGVALLCCAWLGAVQDVARGVVARRNIGARPALFEALLILREDPRGVLFGSYPSASASVLAWLVAVWVSSKLDLASPTTRAVVLAFLVHQAAVVFSLVFRLRWLDAALALGARSSSARD